MSLRDITDDWASLLTDSGCRFERAGDFLILIERRIEAFDPLPRPVVGLRISGMTSTKTKTSRPRTIHLEPSLVRMLEGLHRFLNSEFVFWHDEGQPVSERQRPVRTDRTAGTKAGTDITVRHGLQAEPSSAATT